MRTGWPGWATFVDVPIRVTSPLSRPKAAAALEGCAPDPVCAAGALHNTRTGSGMNQRPTCFIGPLYGPERQVLWLL
jgi:hypothetical protein